MREKKEYFLYLITKIITGVIGIYSMSIQTKYLASNILGDYSLIVGITGVINSILVSWVGSSALRYYYNYSDTNDNKKTFHTTVIIDWTVATLASLLIIFLVGEVAQSVPIKNSLVLVLLVAIISSAMDIIERIMRASNHVYIYCFLLIIESLANVGIILLFKTSMTNGLNLLLIAKIVTASIFVLVSVFTIKSFKYFSLSKYSSSLNKLFFKYGAPMVGVWGISWLLNYSDRYIIKLFLTSSEVGLYDVAYGFSEKTIGLVIYAFNLAFFPSLIKSWKDNGKQKTMEVLKKYFNYYFMFAIPACVGIFLLSPKVYGVLLDSSFSEAYMVMAISSIGFVFMGMNNFLYKIWQLEERTNIVLIVTTICVVVNISTNIFFIPRFGYLAAACTTVLSYIVGTIVLILLVKKRINIIFDIKEILIIFISTFVMGVFLFFVRQFIVNIISLLFTIILSIMIFGIVMFAFGGLKDEIAEFIEWRKRHESH